MKKIFIFAVISIIGNTAIAQSITPEVKKDIPVIKAEQTLDKNNVASKPIPAPKTANDNQGSLDAKGTDVAEKPVAINVETIQKGQPAVNRDRKKTETLADPAGKPVAPVLPKKE